MRNKFFNFLIAIGSVVVLFAILVIIDHTQKIDAFEDIPNFSQIKGKITATELDYSKQPYLGSPNARIKIVEFGDFKCPACKNWAMNIKKQFLQDFIDTGKVEFFFVNYAFLDRDSYMAAAAGEAIARQNNSSFWEYYDKLYATQGDESEIWATKKFILNFVKENVSGIDYEKFVQDIESQKYFFDVKEDFKIAGMLGVNGTPQFLINGKLYRLSTYEEMQAIIDQEIALLSN